MKKRKETRFWITCPHCKSSFGVPPDLVLKFIDRLLNELTERIERSGRKIQKEERGA